MSDSATEAWLDRQQREHNYRSFAHELAPIKPIRAKRQPFTLTQLLVAERWLEKKETA